MHPTILKGIVGGVELTVLQKFERMAKGAMDVCLSVKGYQQG